MAAPAKSSGAFGRWLKRIIWLGIIGGGGYYAWDWYNTKNDAPVSYRTSPVTQGKLTQAVTATGQLNALVTVQVGSQISGTLEKINVDFNSPVKAGQLIAQLDAATYRAVAAQMKGDVANAQASLDLAKLNAQRKQELHEQKLAPGADYDKSVADLHQAEAVLQVKQAALEKAQVDLRRCDITSPIDGMVISRKVDVGQTVAANFNSPVLFEIANDLAKMQIHANVAEADVGGVEPGQEVEFNVDAFPDRVFKGKVQQVRNAPVTVDNVVTYDTVIDVDNSDLKLKPGMTANVSIILAQRSDALLVANAAMRWKPAEEATDKKPEGEARGERGEHGKGKRDKEKGQNATKTVYILPDGQGAKPQAVSITVGITDSLKSEVLSGLSAGQNVIIGVTLPVGASNSNPMGSPFGGPPRR